MAITNVEKSPGKARAAVSNRPLGAKSKKQPKTTMPEYYNNLLCVSYPELTDRPDPVMTMVSYNQYVHRSPDVRIRRGSPAGPALLAWDYLRRDIKERYEAKYGNPHKSTDIPNRLEELISHDHAAGNYFNTFIRPDGKDLEPNRRIEYTTNATLLNAVGKRYWEIKMQRSKQSANTKKIWPVVAGELAKIETDPQKDGYPHTLPLNYKRLQEKYNTYMHGGKPNYDSLIHGGYGNKSANIINDVVERLILSLYVAENLPFGDWVHDDYLQFLSGNKDIVDYETGVLLDREDYYDEKKGTYRVISKSSVWNILNKPNNKIIVDRLRNNRIDHITMNTPFNKRKSPTYSLSKISIDDRTFSRKTADGKDFTSYVAFDVTSGAMIGCVRGIGSPTVDWVWDCLRDMYRTLDKNHLMWPGELECENHLCRDIEDQLRDMFAFVTFTTPGVSRNKRAEHFIRGKKHGDEKRNQVGIGRWNGKGAYKTKSESKDPDYKQPRLPIEQLIAEDIESVKRYNNSLHPEQKKFKGKTRWQVLVENMNPDLSRPQKFRLMKHLGRPTETSIRNNDYCMVQYEMYEIDNLESIFKLKPNNYNVTAYYMPELSGNIPEVFIYQGNTFIGKATKAERYNEAKIERTQEDERIRTDAAKRQAKFFKFEKEETGKKISRKLKPYEAVPVPETVEIVNDSPIDDELTPERLEQLERYYTTGVKERALESI